MAKLRVYHYPQCSTCKKALKWLAAHDVSVELMHIVEQPPSKTELREVLKSGIPLKKLFNTSGASYRDGGFGDRLKTMSEAEAIDALVKDGKLVKRPVVLGKGVHLVGFDEAAYEDALG